MLNQIDLNRLRIFSLVFNKGGIQAAALVLNVSRSAVSQHIGNLERELGFPLFTRSHKKIVPTREAQELQAQLIPFLSNLEDSLTRARTGRNKPSGLLRIGAPMAFGTHEVTNTMARFHHAHPDVRFQLTLGTPPELCEHLLKGAIDFCVLDAADVFEKIFPIVTESLFKEEQVLVGSSPYIKKNLKERPSYDDLLKLSFVSHVSEGTEIKFWFRHHFRKIPHSLDLSLVCNHVHGLITAVKGGLGMGLIPSRLIQKELKSRQLVSVKTSHPEYINKIALAQLPDKRPSITEKAFIKFLGESITT